MHHIVHVIINVLFLSLQVVLRALYCGVSTMMHHLSPNIEESSRASYDIVTALVS